MTSSARANAALLQSLQRARDRQGPTSARTSADTTSLYSNPERKPVKLDERPPWNGGNVVRGSKTPRSVFLDNPSAVENGQAGRRTPSPRPPPSHHETSSATRVMQVPPPPPIATTSASNKPVYVQYSQPMYPYNTKVIRSEPEAQVIMMEPESNKSSCCDCFREKNTHRKGYYADREGLLRPVESPVYRGCQCCARGRLASACPSCYFCELFYGCPFYCWLLTFLLLLLPMLALFGWFLSEQPALNPAKRQYVTRQSSVVQNDVYAVMRNCAVPYCTNASPSTTIDTLYLTYHDYAVTQVVSHGQKFKIPSPLIMIVVMLLKAMTAAFYCE